MQALLVERVSLTVAHLSVCKLLTAPECVSILLFVGISTHQLRRQHSLSVFFKLFLLGIAHLLAITLGNASTCHVLVIQQRFSYQPISPTFLPAKHIFALLKPAAHISLQNFDISWLQCHRSWLWLL